MAKDARAKKPKSKPAPAAKRGRGSKRSSPKPDQFLESKLSGQPVFVLKGYILGLAPLAPNRCTLILTRELDVMGGLEETPLAIYNKLQGNNFDWMKYKVSTGDQYLLKKYVVAISSTASNPNSTQIGLVDGRVFQANEKIMDIYNRLVFPA